MLEAIIFVADPPTFRIDDDGLVHITQKAGGLVIERVMRLHTFHKTIHLAKQAVREYEARGTAKVIAFHKASNGH